MKKLHLAAIDLDGTLLSGNGVISQENADAIRVFQQAGNHVSICTGRDPMDVSRLLKDADLICEIIGINGAVVWSDGRCLKSVPINKEFVNTLLHRLEEHEIYYHVYTNKGIFAPDCGRKRLEVEIDRLLTTQAGVNQSDLFQRAHGYLNQFGLIPVPHFSSFWEEDIEIFKILPFSYIDENLRLIKAWTEEIDELLVTSSGRHNLEINDISANKGLGMTALADYLRIPMENTVAIGDNLNDLPMMMVAGMPIAMGNAVEELKTYCKFITLTNEKNGVAFALKQLLASTAV